MDRVPEPSDKQAVTRDDPAGAPAATPTGSPQTAPPSASDTSPAVESEGGVAAPSGSDLSHVDEQPAEREPETDGDEPADGLLADQSDGAEDGVSPESAVQPPDADADPVAPQMESLTKLTIAQLKDKIMASTPGNDEMNQVSDTIKQTVEEAQTRAKAAYEKGTEAVTEMTNLAKGNVEALVESTKVIAAGMQDIGRTYAEEAKAAYEQITADMKELAAIKSPTELFQLQGKIMRRNFDSLVATSSKNTEAMMKLVNEAFTPLSNRMSAAAEKMTKMP